MQALFELLAGLIAEGLREFQQWWSNRARLRAATPAEAPDVSPARSPAVAVDVEPLVARLLVQHARRHVGVAVGVLRGDRSWFVAAGTAAPGRSSPPLADAIFEIGSVTKLFTALLLAAVDSRRAMIDAPSRCPTGIRPPSPAPAPCARP